MNATSRAILQTILATDDSLSAAEKIATKRLVDGEVQAPSVFPTSADEQLLVTQKRAAELLCVSRATVWRMTKDSVLHPVEILPGTWRYPFREILGLARKGAPATTVVEEHLDKSAA